MTTNNVNTQKMNPFVKRKLVARLKDESYVQCYGALAENLPNGSRAYCANGMICKLYADDNGIPFDNIFTPLEGTLTRYRINESYYPKIVRWAGLSPDNGLYIQLIISSGEVRSLIQLNDMRKMTFPVMAALIEEQL